MNDDGPAPGDESEDEDGDAQVSDRKEHPRAGIDGAEGAREDPSGAERDHEDGPGEGGATTDEVSVGREGSDSSETEPVAGTTASSGDAAVEGDDPIGGEATNPRPVPGRDDTETAAGIDRVGAAAAPRVGAEDAHAGAPEERPDAAAPDDGVPAGPDDGVSVVPEDDVPEDVRRYDRFQKVDRASYDRVNEFLRDRTYITAREWAIARLCADFRTATGVEMTKIGQHLPELVPFMTDTYSPQAVNQARSAFEEKVRMAGATFLYGAMSGFFTADELDDLMYEVTEVSKFLLEVEGVELTVDEELDAEDRISAVMREVRRASEELRFDEVACPHCGEAFRPESED